MQWVEIEAVDKVWVVRSGEKERLTYVDTIIFDGERRPNQFLAAIADKKGIESIIVGDANGVAGEGQGVVMAAIASGYDAALQI